MKPFKPDGIHVWALQQARVAIESGGHEFVCLALPRRFNASEDIEALIQHRMQNGLSPEMQWAVVKNWLYYLAGVPWCELTDERMREYRLRWIDSLIAEFEAAIEAGRDIQPSLEN